MTEDEAEFDIDALPPGVRDGKVESLAEGGLRCFYSRVEDLTGTADSFRADALRFHAVVQAMLRRAAVAPFRFPTLLKTDREIREFLASNASTHLEALRRMRGKVQMEVRIKLEAVSPEPRSGREYMDACASEAHALNTHADAVLAAARELILEWQVRHEARGVRCYALVSREHVANFEECIRGLSPVNGASIMVSGPWPPSEFLHVRNS